MNDAIPPLSPRGESVLRVLIETYLQAGEPVGSRLLAKRFPESLSSATIRNVLSDLEDERLVSQPHTSAGRIPTEKAYRYYVDRLVQAPDLIPDGRLVEALQGLDLDPEAWVRHATRVLSEVLQSVVIALPPAASGSRLLRLEFVPLGPQRMVAVWVGTGGEVEHRVLENPWAFEPGLLVELGNFATETFAGLQLVEMRQRVVERLLAGADEGRRLVERLATLTHQLEPSRHGLEDASVVVAGLNQLGSHPEFSDLDQFRALVAVFDGQEQLLRLLNAFATPNVEEVKLLLGTENPFLGAMPLATAMRTVNLGAAGFATFGVVGPLRTDYPRLLGGLKWWSDQVALRRT